MDSVKRYREDINQIDAEIIDLLNRRMKLSKKVGRLKKKRNLPITDSKREDQVLKRVKELAEKTEIDLFTMQEIYEKIILASRKAQGEEEEVAFLGPRGTFCEQATRRYFRGTPATFIEKTSISDVFRAVSVGEAISGVVPVENSIEGSVNLSLDLLMEMDLSVCGEIEEKIRHNLITSTDPILERIKTIISHPQALSQCRKYIETNFPEAKLQDANSTAMAVKKLVNMRMTAAIGTELSAQLYGMKIVAKGIEDNPDNYTRFFVLSTNDAEPTGSDKTSLVFSVPHKPGALCNALQTLSNRGINLTKIESRPARTALWEYVFFCDFEGHRKDEKIIKALKVLDKKCVFLKILGSYPKARL